MITAQHRLYKSWLSELDFYKEELEVFEKELALLVEKHPELFSILEHVEEYQRILVRKNERIRLLREHIKANDSSFDEKPGQESAPWSFDQVQQAHTDFVEKMESLKKNFRRFVAKNTY